MDEESSRCPCDGHEVGYGYQDGENTYWLCRDCMGDLLSALQRLGDAVLSPFRIQRAQEGE